MSNTTNNENFKNALSHFASGVTVVTFQHNNEFGGLTVSSFSSLSLNPPLILFCLLKTTNSYGSIINSQEFVVNFLDKNQEMISNRFASGKEDKNALIQEIGFRQNLIKSPILPNCLTNLECKIENVYEGGDHSIIVGKVLEVHADDDKRPLIYYRRKYYDI